MRYAVGEVIHVIDTGLLRKPQGYGVIIEPKLGHFFFINSPKGKGKYFHTEKYIRRNRCYMIKKKDYPKLPGDSCIVCYNLDKIHYRSEKNQKMRNKVTRKAGYHLNVKDLKGLLAHIESMPFGFFSEDQIELYRKRFHERIDFLESSGSR